MPQADPPGVDAGPAAFGLRLRNRIATEGPISVATFMAEATAHYYATRTAFGTDGDFVTAPDISQMFGELLGLWAVDAWTRMGRPQPFALIELGPGRGALMADALRAARLDPAFGEAASLHLVETSARLRALQAERLAAHRPAWHDDLDAVPELPAILIGNEFLDALPIRQFVRQGDGFHERMIGLDASGALCFGLAAEPTAIAHLLTPRQAAAPAGSLVEICQPARALIARLGQRFAVEPGYAIFIDYGAPVSGIGDTLQAVARHRFVDPLSKPGAVDLTAHVDFGALAREAVAAGLAVFGPIDQGLFLRRIGIELRAESLKRRATPGQAADIDAAVERLTGDEAMGTLFQAIAFASPGLSPPAAFDS